MSQGRRLGDIRDRGIRPVKRLLKAVGPEHLLGPPQRLAAALRFRGMRLDQRQQGRPRNRGVHAEADRPANPEAPKGLDSSAIGADCHRKKHQAISAGEVCP